MQLSSEQSKAVFTESKRALCIAGAGSGKTRVLTSRIKNLVENCHVSPYELMAITFTRKASGEMRERLEEAIGNKAYNITMGTIHSMALKMLQRFGEYVGLSPGKITVYSDWEEKILLKDVCLELDYYNGKSWKGVKKKEVDEAFYLLYTENERDEKAFAANDILDAFFVRCKENNALTYGSILTTFSELLPKISHLLNFRHILIDEVQDLDTCHPPSTLIKTYCGKKGRGGRAILKDIPISRLKNGDKVVTWDRKHGIVKPMGKKISIGKRHFEGNLLKISCGDTSVTMTPDHKVYALMNGTGEDRYVVYLMWRKEYGFRVGQCAIRYRLDTGKKPLNGVGSRFKEEKCEKGWILGVFETKSESMIQEQILSCRYRLPTSVFQPSTHTSIETIKAIFDNIKDDGMKCLSDHGKSFKHPLYDRSCLNGKKAMSKRYFETTVMNLIPELMSIPARMNEETLQTRPFKITSIRKIPYSGDVYSMDVEDDHNYIADGLIVKNCQWQITNKLCELCDASLFAVGDPDQAIFEFRGGDPEYLIRNQNSFDIYTLQDNYRSDGYIVDSANKMIVNNESRLDSTMFPKKEHKNQVLKMSNMDTQGLLEGLQNMPEGHSEGIAVLARNHYMLKKLSRVLWESDIDHEYVGRKTAFTRSEEFRRVHAFLKLAANPFDNFSFLLIKEHIEINGYRDIRLKAVQEDKSHFQVWTESDFSDNQWASEYIEAAKEGNFKETIELMMEIDFSFDSVPVFEFIEEYMAKQFEPKIEGYLSWLAIYDVQDELTGKPKNIQLMTIHASKGLEWPTVVIAGMNEGILPSKHAESNLNELESERRLAYVAYTRAKDQLILTTRPQVGEGDDIKYPVSRFIEESAV